MKPQNRDQTPQIEAAGNASDRLRERTQPHFSLMRFTFFRALFRAAYPLLTLPNNLAIAFLLAYRRLISPIYGEVCKYYPSCSKYALEAYQKRNFLFATLLTVGRLLRCNPWSSGGIDDVPPARTQRTQHSCANPENTEAPESAAHEKTAAPPTRAHTEVAYPRSLTPRGFISPVPRINTPSFQSHTQTHSSRTHPAYDHPTHTHLPHTHPVRTKPALHELPKAKTD